MMDPVNLEGTAHLSIYTGKLSTHRISVIHKLTYTRLHRDGMWHDPEAGKRFYRTEKLGWMPLRDLADFALLNNEVNRLSSI
jgi:hypothetical protein